MTALCLTQLAKTIDHSVLHPTATDAELEKECKLAVLYNVAAICVKPYAVKQAFSFVLESEVKLACVIGFPAGISSIAVKAFEAEMACKDGASEIDMVVNIGKVLSSDWRYVAEEIETVTKVCHQHKAIVKVIFETDYIKDSDIIGLCQICTKVGVDYVKTSTGFGYIKDQTGNWITKGATEHYISLMKRHTGKNIKIKASGGIRNFQQVIKLIEAGADRIGTSATENILKEARICLG